ncbi:MAG: hypothetical protein AAGI68_02750 [Planctomycetota bacterium]
MDRDIQVFEYRPGVVGSAARYALAGDRLVREDEAGREEASWRFAEVGRVYWNTFKSQQLEQRTLTLEAKQGVGGGIGGGVGWKRVRLGCNRGEGEDLEVFRSLIAAVYERLQEEPEPPVFGLGYGGGAHWWFFAIGVFAVGLAVVLPVAAVWSGRGHRLATVEGVVMTGLMLLIGLPLVLAGLPGRRRAVADAAASLPVDEVLQRLRR